MQPMQLEMPPLVARFFPESNLGAVGSLSGALHLFRLGAAGELTSERFLAPRLSLELRHSIPVHTAPLRSLALPHTSSSHWAVTASSDRSLITLDCNSFDGILRVANAHKSKVNALERRPDDTTFCSGDDDGNLKVWDLRARKCVFSCKHHTDYIAAISNFSDSELVVVSGDGTLSVVDLRKRRATAQSDSRQEDYTCIQVADKGGRVLCGSHSGKIDLFSHQNLVDPVERLPPLSASVDSMACLGPRTLVIGLGDGTLRRFSLLPNQDLGEIGAHDGLPVETMATTSDGTKLLTCTEGGQVKGWDVRSFTLEAKGGEGSRKRSGENEGGEEQKPERKRGKKKRRAQSTQSAAVSGFFAELEREGQEE